MSYATVKAVTLAYTLKFVFLPKRIDGNMIIKVADFGLSESIEDRDYLRLASDVDVKLPVMWMAPESLTDCIFSEKTDVVRTVSP